MSSSPSQSGGSKPWGRFLRPARSGSSPLPQQAAGCSALLRPEGDAPCAPDTWTSILCVRPDSLHGREHPHAAPPPPAARFWTAQSPSEMEKPAKLAGGTGRRRGRTPVRPSGAARVLAKRTTSFQGGNKTLRTFRRDGPGGSRWRKALRAFLWGRPPPRPHTRFFPFHIPRGPPLRRSRPRPALRPEMTRTSCLQAQGKSIPTGRAHRAQVAQPPQGLCGQ